MHSVDWVLVCLVLLVLSGSPGKSLKPPKERPESRIVTLRNEGAIAYAKLDYPAAEAIYQRGRASARQLGDRLWEVKFLVNIAGVRFQQHKYRSALEAYLEGLSVANENHYSEVSAVINFNLVSLYTNLGDFEAAEQAAKRGAGAAQDRRLDRYRHKFLACQGLLCSRQGDVDRARFYFEDAIQRADRVADPIAMTRYLGALGEALLLSGRYREADAPLTEAFRDGLIYHDPDLRWTLLDLSWLRLEQGDLRAAAALMRNAEALPARETGLPPYFITYLHGRILRSEGRNPEALAAFRSAVDSGRALRDLPSDALRMDSTRDQVFRQVVEAYSETSLTLNPLGTEAFIASEEDRASAVRGSRLGSEAWRKNLPPRYATLLQQLKAALAGEAGGQSASGAIQAVRLSMVELEVQAGAGPISTIGTKSFEKSTSVAALRGMQRSLRPDEALLSFYLGKSVWSLWAVTQDRFQIYHLPDSDAIRSLVSEFRLAVKNGDDSSERLGEDLYRRIFGQLDPGFLNKTTWILSLSNPLSETPFAALVADRDNGRPVYLIQKHVVIQVPSALLLTEKPSPGPGDTFLGVGDGVYNSADPRWPRTAAPGVGPAAIYVKKPAQLDLGRLVGSGVELKQSSRYWNSSSPPVLLLGSEASRAHLELAMRGAPGVIHIAAHVLSRGSDDASIDLGLKPDGSPELLTKDDIAAIRAQNALVVMSGCSSADGDGTGAWGLTLAWMRAGARAVIGSRWPTPDDTGELFQSFYRHLHERISRRDRLQAIGEALRLAQLDMLQSQTWRSGAQYWSAFYVFGKE